MNEDPSTLIENEVTSWPGVGIGTPAGADCSSISDGWSWGICMARRAPTFRSRGRFATS